MPHPEVMLDAAHLALWFSALRHDDRGDVQWARKKQLKKPGKGAPPGLVIIHGEHVMHVRVEPERLQRLLAAEIPAV
jgi:predicted ribosome quality control (RQC) complex YloA/Tae2 family protein